MFNLGLGEGNLFFRPVKLRIKIDLVAHLTRADKLINTHTHTHTHIYIYIDIYTHTHTHTYIYIYMCVCACVCVCDKSNCAFGLIPKRLYVKQIFKKNSIFS